MITRLTTVTLNLLKTNISIVLLFYASGFLSFIAYNRVLGLSYIIGSSQIYAEMAGKNLLIILQTFIFLVTQPNYFIENIDALNWVGNILIIWLAAVFLIGIIYIIFKLSHPKPIIIAIRRHRYTIRILLGLITITVLTIFHIETQSFYAVNVLQPAYSAVFQQQKMNVVKYEQETKNTKKREKIAGQLNHYTKETDDQLSNDTKEIAGKINFDKEEIPIVTHLFFSIPKNTYDRLGNDKKRMNALRLMILMVSITAIILVSYRRYILIKWLIFFFSFAQAILIPFNCGILGSSYQYPVISLAYTEKDDKAKESVLHKEGVFLLAKSQDSLIIYDRLDFFQISYIPQSAVIHLEQFFNGSPFSNCGSNNGDFKPCENYAIKQ